MAAPEVVARAAKAFNPVALKASSKAPPFATVHHVGRRSGKQYATPVVAFAARDEAADEVLVLTPLPWGQDTDWVRNLRAAGSFRLTRGGHEYQVDRVRVLDADEAGALLAPAPRMLATGLGIGQFLAGRLHRAPMV
ncbi:nitroreductase family deazaflavin-dependent oxidoreductase [Antribacter gilvus]|uniref:nitroreductase family deazaflavin-dependent oxidoreductase n=1 Tax=Antribacter gilvus TaxID=2304675 RepID=UPI000F7A27F4|nr:nitroreductase family deazaflavin-dependent oxidoreductase [Antribacter gilvus]